MNLLDASPNTATSPAKKEVVPAMGKFILLEFDAIFLVHIMGNMPGISVGRVVVGPIGDQNHVLRRFSFLRINKMIVLPEESYFQENNKTVPVSINYKLNKLTAGSKNSEKVLKWVAHFVRLRLTFPSHSTSCTCCHYYYRRSDHLED